MSRIKKMLGVFMAAMLCFALTPMAAFAAESGSIKVDNAIEGQTYKLYKIADLKVSGTNKTSYAYTPAKGWEAFWETIAKDSSYGISIVKGNIVFDGESMASNDATIAKLATVARDWKDKPAANWTETAGKDEVVFKNLPLGYFFLDSTTGTICSLTSSAPNDTIREKNDVPSVDKEVLENSDNDWHSSNNASIGDTVNFQTTITVAKGAKNYIYHDKMDKGLTFNNAVVVTVDNAVVSADNYTFTTDANDGCTFEVAFNDSYIKDQVGKKIVIAYSAVLNKDAYLSTDSPDNSNDNEAKLTYGDNNVVSNEDETKTYTGSMTVFKHNENGEALAGAEFTLTNTSAWATSSEPMKFIKLDDQTYRPAVGDEEGASATLTSPEGGRFTIVGLDAGTYALTETKAPEGYNMLTVPESVTITADETTSAVGIGNADVENKTGLELPSTGGIGTTVFYIVGGVLVVGAIAFLIVRRRMNSAK